MYNNKTKIKIQTTCSVHYAMRDEMKYGNIWQPCRLLRDSFEATDMLKLWEGEGEAEGEGEGEVLAVIWFLEP